MKLVLSAISYFARYDVSYFAMIWIETPLIVVSVTIFFPFLFFLESFQSSLFIQVWIYIILYNVVSLLIDGSRSLIHLQGMGGLNGL